MKLGPTSPTFSFLNPARSSTAHDFVTTYHICRLLLLPLGAAPHSLCPWPCRHEHTQQPCQTFSSPLFLSLLVTMSSIVHGMRVAVECFVAGVLDSIRFPHTAIFFVTSKVVRVRFMQCLVLNGGLFLSSVLLADYVLTPAFHWLLDVNPSAPLSLSWLPSTLSSLLLSVFYVVWVYPLYALSFLLNAIWYQDIADQAFLTRGHKQHVPALSFQRWVAAMSEELYRLLLVSLFLVQLSLVSLLPVVGPPLALLHMCWLYSLYSFEYKWQVNTHTTRQTTAADNHNTLLRSQFV